MTTQSALNIALLPPSNKLSLAIQDTIDPNAITRDPYKARNGCMAINVAIAIIGKIPLYFIAMKMPIWAPIRPIPATVEAIDFGILNSWVIEHTATALCGAQTSHEAELLNRGGRSMAVRSLMMITAIFISIFAQLPNALPALSFLGEYGQIGFLVLLLSSIYYSVDSFYQLLDHLLEMRNKAPEEEAKKIEAARQALMGLIGQHAQKFLEDSQEQQLDFAGSVESLSVSEYIGKVTQIEPFSGEATSVQTSSDKVVHWFGIYNAIFLQVALAIYTWIGTEENFSNNLWVVLGITLAEVATNCYLMGDSVVKTNKVVADLILCKKGPQVLANILDPSLTGKLKKLGTGLAALGFPTTWVIWGKFFENNPSLALFFQLELCYNLFLILLTANLSCAERIVEKTVARTGTSEQKTVLTMYQRHQKLLQLIGSSSLVDFASLLQNSCPMGVRDQVLFKANLSNDELGHFLETQQPRQFSVSSNV